MPRNIEITEEEQNVYEKGGGIKDATKKEREWVANDYFRFAEKLGKSTPQQFEEDSELLSKNFSSYFWSMRVSVYVSLKFRILN